MFKRILTAGLLFGMAGTAPPAHAQSNCAMRDTVVERLSENYAEQLTAGGLQPSAPNTVLIEVWSSPETGTFTVILTKPNGVSCIVAAGTDFYVREPVVAKKETAS